MSKQEETLADAMLHCFLVTYRSGTFEAHTLADAVLRVADAVAGLSLKIERCAEALERIAQAKEGWTEE